MLTADQTISTRQLAGFSDPKFGAAEWARLLATGSTDTVFQTWEWQSTWWQVFGRGELLLLAAERAGQVVAVAPFFTEAGMVYFVGSGGSDYLDFIGEVGDPEVLAALLLVARQRVKNFIGFVFYHVPETSRTAASLAAAAGQLQLKLFAEGSQPAPGMNLSAANLQAALAKKSLVRHEKFFTRDGALTVAHETTPEKICPQLEQFFDQHIARWSQTDFPSLFGEVSQREFYRKLAEAAPAWLRFTRLEWQGRAVAFHFGFCYRGQFLWYKPSFDVALARHSPGEVLLRQLLLRAGAEGATVFDFGLGDEAFKARFATHTHHVGNWGLYEPAAIAHQ